MEAFSASTMQISLNVQSMFVIFIVLLAYVGQNMAVETASRKYEIFPTTERLKWIQVSQLEEIFQTIVGLLEGLTAKQQRDAISIEQVSNELHAIDQRLRNIESQIAGIEQTESFNKYRSQQLADNTAKQEIQTEDLKRKLEKNQQQMNNRLNEIDSSLEKIYNTQDSVQKEIRKSFNTLVTSVGELTENSKTEASRLVQTLNSGQQQLRQEFTDTLQNLTNFNDGGAVIKIQEPHSNKQNSKPNQNDAIQSEVLASISALNEKYNRLQGQIQEVEKSVKECVSVGDKIYNKIERDTQDTRTNFDTLLDVINEMKSKNEADFEQLETKISINFDNITEEHSDFKNNCYRLQVKEQQLEDATVNILRKLFSYIKNSTEGVRVDLKRISNLEQFRCSHPSGENENVQRILSTAAYLSTRSVDETKKPVTSTSTENGTGSTEKENDENTHTESEEDTTLPKNRTSSQTMTRKTHSVTKIRKNKNATTPILKVLDDHDSDNIEQ